MTALIFASRQFPKETKAFEVVTVPKIWVNDRIYIDGAAPSETMMTMTLMDMIRQALDESIPKGKFQVTQ